MSGTFIGMPAPRWTAVAALCDITVNCSAPLDNSAPTPEALGSVVLEAISRRDEAALRRLALVEQEFRENVWPELPASRPERNLPFSYVWGDLRTKSDAGLARVLQEHGGRHYTLERLRFKGATQYHSYIVHRESILDVRGEDGHRETLQLFGSVIEKGGRFKVFSYVVD